MKKSAVSVLLVVVMALSLSSCSDRNKLIRELYQELEKITEEKQSVGDELEAYKQKYEEIKEKNEGLEYERDAFSEENVVLRAGIDDYREKEEMLEDAVESANYTAGLYRQDLADIAEFMTYDDVFCPYSDEVPKNHREAIDYHMAEYVDMLRNETNLLHDPEVIFGVISVSPMPQDELHRPARENCAYYKVIYYASRINPYEPGEIYIMPRGMFDGLTTHWLIEVEDFEEGSHVIVFEPNA